MVEKRRIKPRFWALLAVFVVSSISLYANCKTGVGTPKLNVSEGIVTEVNAIEVKDYILNIPLSWELQEELHEACEEFGVDYYIMVALIDRETKFRNLLGDCGNSIGYCQIQPKWWYGLMAEIGATDLNVPKDNFRTACAIMAQLMEKYRSLEGALVAYNQGYYRGYSTPYSRDIIAKAEMYRQ